MKRPKYTDVPLRTVAEELAKDLEHLKTRDTQDEDIVDALEDALKTAGCSNGYQIAKELEKNSAFRPDSMLVEMLDAAWYIRSTMHDELVKKWVSWHNITPNKKIGDHVRISFRGKEGLGQIRNIDLERATYLVYAEELDVARKEDGKLLGVVINFEDILPVELAA